MQQVKQYSALLAVSVAALTLGAPPVDAALTMSLSAGTEEIAVYEALPVTVTIRNDSPVSAEYDGRLFRDHELGTLRIERPDGESIIVDRPELWLEVIENEYATVTLPPGAEKQHEMVVSCDWGLYKPVFTAQGVYRLTATYTAGSQTIESNTVAVRVTAPPATEMEALHVVEAMETPEMLYEPGLTRISRWRQRLGELESLASIRDSRLYANYARLTLARRYLDMAEGARRPADRDEYIRQATVWADRIDTEPDFALATLVTRTKSRAERLKEQR